MTFCELCGQEAETHDHQGSRVCRPCFLDLGVSSKANAQEKERAQRLIFAAYLRGCVESGLGGAHVDMDDEIHPHIATAIGAYHREWLQGYPYPTVSEGQAYNAGWQLAGWLFGVEYCLN